MCDLCWWGIVYPAVIEVGLYGAHPGRSSLDTYYEIRDAREPDRVYTLGHGVLVWYDHAAGRSSPLPQAVRDLFT